jgi:hypothetical protein
MNWVETGDSFRRKAILNKEEKETYCVVSEYTSSHQEDKKSIKKENGRKVSHCGVRLAILQFRKLLSIITS